MAVLEYFTVVCNGLGAIQIDWVDPGTDPDEEIVYAWVDFIPREEPGTVHWLEGLTPPRGIQLDPIRGRFSSEDGRLRTIIGHPTNEKQKVTATGTPITLTYAGQTTASFPNTAPPWDVQTALENLSNIAVGDVYVSGVMQNERQTVTIGGGATGGHFALVLDGQTTTPISRNASASTVQASLQALSNVGSDGCSVTGPVGGPWVVEFTGTLAGANINPMTVAQRSEIQVVTITGTPTGGQLRLVFNGQTTADIAYNALAATVQAALVALPNIAPGDVVVTGADGGPWTLTFGGALANQDVSLIGPVTERNEIQTVAITGTPTGGTFTLTYAGSTTAPINRFSTAAAVRTALEALPNISPGDVAVSGGGFIGEGPWTVKFQSKLLGNQNIAAMTATSALTPSGGVIVTTTVEGVGIIDGSARTDTVQEAIFLTPTGSGTVTTTQTGSTGTPWTVNFIGTLAATDVAQMTATNATVTTTTGGDAVAGVKLVANTTVMDLDELIYDVHVVVPDLDPLKEDRIVIPFGIVAPTTGGVVIDLADASRHVPPKPV